MGSTNSFGSGSGDATLSALEEASLSSALDAAQWDKQVDGGALLTSGSGASEPGAELTESVATAPVDDASSTLKPTSASTADADAGHAQCGDGTTQSNEECDDGNPWDGDGCSFRCTHESLALGNDFTCVKSSAGRVKCWGGNRSGQLGIGDDQPRGYDQSSLPSLLPWVDLDGEVRVLGTGNAHVCGLLTNSAVKCWGANAAGQLGVGDRVNHGDQPGEMGAALPAVSLSAREGDRPASVFVGHAVSCTRFESGRLKCWGQNGSGQLGVGHTRDLGLRIEQMGDELPDVDMGRDVTAVRVVGGTSHTCALLSDHTVKCWGSNRDGALGLGDVDNRGDGPDEMGDHLPRVNLGQAGKVVTLAAGRFHTCAVFESGRVKCWGVASETSATLGLGDSRTRGAVPSDMGDALPFVDLGTRANAVAIAAGYDMTCVLLDDHRVKCWGLTELSTANPGVGDLPEEMGDALPFVDLGANALVREIAVGRAHACARLHAGTLKCWGNNSYGNLGLGDFETRGDDPDEMGDALPTISVDL